MEQQNLNNHEKQDMDDDDYNDSFPVSTKVIGWGIAAIAFAIFAVTFNNSGMVLRAGFFGKAFAVLIGALLGWGGALIGDALCRFARPSAVFTQGGFFSLVFLKLFWIAGPQVIGLAIGVMLGISQVLSRI
tara:strand:- start:10532 stop:10924 length:393 start_codon:yes stop_codon:yes gene_type:complete